MFEATRPVLQELVRKAKEKGTPWLFSNPDGTHFHDIGTIRGFKKSVRNGKVIKSSKWYKLIEDCNIDYRHLKNTRHTFAVRMIEMMSVNENITFQVIAEILGHGSLKMLQEHYAKWIKGHTKKIDRSFNVYGV